jgi:calcineurin-like phosphoesterase family protein
MNLKLISNWNGCINPNDIVFHLGDFGEPESIKYLNGKIILLNEYGD